MRTAGRRSTSCRIRRCARTSFSSSARSTFPRHRSHSGAPGRGYSGEECRPPRGTPGRIGRNRPMIFTKRPTPKAAQPPPGPRELARGERVSIREFERVDVDRWMAWPRHTDPLFDTYNAPRMNDRQRDTYYRQYRESPDARQFSVDAPGCALVGRISLREIDCRLGVSVLGVSFNPARLNQGFGSDALWTFLGYYFGPLKMR